MPWIPDPRRRWRLFARCAVTTPIIAVIGGSGWAWRELPSITIPDPTTASMGGATPLPTLDPQAFQVSLWRPFADQPSANMAIQATAVTLFSVMRRQGVLTAAIDFGPGEGLQYLVAGQVHGAVKVIAIDASGVDITVNGAAQRLGAVK